MSMDPNDPKYSDTPNVDTHPLEGRGPGEPAGAAVNAKPLTKDEVEAIRVDLAKYPGPSSRHPEAPHDPLTYARRLLATLDRLEATR